MLHKLPNSNLISTGLILLAPTVYVSESHLENPKFMNSVFSLMHMYSKN